MAVSSETLTNTCPCCSGGLACGIAADAPCACTSVTLDEATLSRLRAQYSGCLCLVCLNQLSAALASTSSRAIAQDPRD